MKQNSTATDRPNMNSPIIQRQPKQKYPAQLSKAMSEALHSLYGPNGQDVPVHKSETRRLAAFMELQRHGLVYLQAQEEMGIFHVKRQQWKLKEQA